MLRARRQPRRRPLARRHRGLVAAREQGLPRLHRMGGGAAVEQRQGRPRRHLLLRDEPVVRGVALSRRTSRRSACGKARRTTTATWRGTAASCARSSAPGSDRTLIERQHGFGERGARSRVTGEPVAGPPTLPDDVLAGNRIDPGPEALARPLDGPYYRERSPRLRQDHRAAAVGGELGRHGAASARQLRGLSGGGLDAEMAAGARRLAFLAVLPPRRRDAAEALLRPFPQGRATPAGTGSRRCSCTSATRARRSWCATSRNGRSRARNGPGSISTRRRALCPARRHPAPRSTTTRAATACASRCRRRPRRSRSPGRWRRSYSSRRTPPTPTCFSRCACSIRPARRCCSSARTTPTCRSRSAGCAPRSASSIVSAACPIGPGIRMTRAGRSRRASRSSSTSRSCRPRSWCRRAFASCSTCAAATSTTAWATAASRTPPTRCAAPAICCTTTRRTARPRSSAAATGCISRPDASRSCCCRSSRGTRHRYIRPSRIGSAGSRCRAARKRSAQAWMSWRDSTSNIALWRARRSASGMASACPIAAATLPGS